MERESHLPMGTSSDGVARFPDGGLWHFFGPPEKTFDRVRMEVANRHALVVAGVNNDPDHPIVHLAVANRLVWKQVRVPSHLFYTGFDYINYLAMGRHVFGANIEGGDSSLNATFLSRLSEFVFGDGRRVLGSQTLTSIDLFLAPAMRPRKLFVWKRGEEPIVISPPFTNSSNRDTFLGGVIVRSHTGTGEIASLLLSDAIEQRQMWHPAITSEPIDDISLGADDGGVAIITTKQGTFIRLSVDRYGKAQFETGDPVKIPKGLRSIGTLVRIAGDTATFVRRTNDMAVVTNVIINTIKDESVKRLFNAALWSASMA